MNGKDGDLAGLRPVRARIRQPGYPISPQERDLRERLVRQRDKMRASRCPTCGNEPRGARARFRQRQDLAIVWLYPDPDRPGAVIQRHHCAQCQPHRHCQTVVCPLCADGPIIAGDLADLMSDERPPPEPVRRWLAEHGWHNDPDDDLVCPDHQRSRS